MYILVTVVAAFLTAFVAVLIWYLFVDYVRSTAIDVFQLLAVYLILSIVLTVAWVQTRLTIKKFERFTLCTKGKNTLLTTVYTVFTLSYITREAFNIYAAVISNSIDTQEVFDLYVLANSLPIVWDVVPIGLILIYHYKNFK